MWKIQFNTTLLVHLGVATKTGASDAFALALFFCGRMVSWFNKMILWKTNPQKKKQPQNTFLAH